MYNYIQKDIESNGKGNNMLIEITIIALNLILNLYRKFSLTLKITVMKNLALESAILVPVLLFITVTIVEYFIIIFNVFFQLF